LGGFQGLKKKQSNLSALSILGILFPIGIEPAIKYPIPTPIMSTILAV